ncbi:MAG: CCA tRNA nucleotidyltransferase, partial [Eubacteriales bacterium]|nr:CCA tRNA nucleotidyltransferase [Eubacteriales bacterium]
MSKKSEDIHENIREHGNIHEDVEGKNSPYANINLDIALPENVEDIITRLNLEGYEAYAVGGCVRDSVLHRQAADWDITTNALPNEISSYFEKTIETGIEHGTITVLIGKTAYEVTTYRSDSIYSDYRDPDNVSFSSSLNEDLKRRDFTVNAMAFHPKTGLIDRYGGLEDIKRRSIRAVGDPDKRFGEDALRMLRAVRFSAQLGFTIETATFEAIKRNSSLIKHISIERIRDELTGILVSQNPDRIAVLKQAGILSHILPELDEVLKPDTASSITASSITASSITASSITASLNTACSLTARPGTTSLNTAILKPLSFLHKSSKIRWAAFMLIANGNTETMQRLRLDKKTIDFISRIIKSIGENIGDEPADVRKAASRIGKDIFLCVILILLAFLRGCGICADDSSETSDDTLDNESAGKFG